MFFQNLHAHSTYDDGKSTLREMILASREAGLTSVGISMHAPMNYDCSWDVKRSRVAEYMAEMAALRAEFADQIEVFTGIEWDVLSDIDLTPFDYAIGSVHHMVVENPPPCVDDSLETTQRVIAQYYGGDPDAMAEAYFVQYDAVAAQPMAQIVGHLDLLTKMDEQEHIFRTSSPRYRKAVLDAMEKPVKAGKIFEINTGAISRGCRTLPYPHERWLNALREMGGKITLSADAHHVSGVACAYEQAEALAKKCGFRQIYALVRGADGPRFEAFDW